MAHVEKPDDKPRIGYHGPGHYRVKVEVVEKLGRCGNGHEVGDTWYVEHVTPGGVCLAAMGAMLPMLNMLENGGAFAWKENKDETFVACPDKGLITFKLTRMREE